LPRVANLPPGWQHFTTAEKIDHLIGLDRCYEILSWGPITELDPLRRSFQWQVMRVLWSIGIKAMLDGTLAREAARERNRQRVLEELNRKLRRSRPRRTERRRRQCDVYGENRADVEVEENCGSPAAGHDRKARSVERIDRPVSPLLREETGCP
jgi:hypothetical protein